MTETPLSVESKDPLLEIVVRNAPIVLFATDASGVLTLSRGRALDAMGLAQGQLVGRSVFDLYTDEPMVAAGARSALAGETVTVPLRLDDVFHETMFAPIWEGGTVTGIVGVATDVTDRTRALEELQRRMLFDAATGLANRTHITALADEAIAVARGRGQPVAMIAIQLGRFQEVADTMGHATADEAVKEAASRLRGLVSAGIDMARLESGRLAVLIPGAPLSESMMLAHRSVQALRSPYRVIGRYVDMQPSVGIALFPGHADTGERLLRRAESTLQAAARMTDGVAFYSPTRLGLQAENLRLVGDLQAALDAGELLLHYQPLVDLNTGRVRGVEALARWTHPELGPIPPDRFVSLAESSGLIRVLTTYVLEHAARQAHAWHEAGVPLRVDINVSPQDLLAVDFLDNVESTLGAWGLGAGSLGVEMTERVMLEDSRTAAEHLRMLDRLGVHLAIDDFGTGQSNMTALKQLPFHSIKIDKLFVRDVPSDNVDRAIISSVVSLATAMGRETIAEGVEAPEVWDTLIDLGCGTAQGYHIARPMPGDQLALWLASGPWTGPTSAVM